MTNYEKYKDKIKDCVNVCTLRGSKCTGSYCVICGYENYKWLGTEYTEPEIDWSKVEQMTKIYDSTGNMKGYFIAKYGEVIVYSVAHKEEDAILELKYCDSGVCRLEK